MDELIHNEEVRSLWKICSLVDFDDPRVDSRCVLAWFLSDAAEIFPRFSGRSFMGQTCSQLIEIESRILVDCSFNQLFHMCTSPDIDVVDLDNLLFWDLLFIPLPCAIA